MSQIKIDMNSPEFQKDLFNLEKCEQTSLIQTLRKISQLSWDQLYKDRGLKWEAIISKKTKSREFTLFDFQANTEQPLLEVGNFLEF